MHTGTRSNVEKHRGGGVFSGWQEGGRGDGRRQARSLHSAAVVAQHLALLAEVLGVLLALVGHVQTIRLLQGSLQRGRGKRPKSGEEGAETQREAGRRQT